MISAKGSVMTLEMRRKLARENFPEKIRKVGELIRLSAKLKAVRTGARNLARTSPSAVAQAKADLSRRSFNEG
jgi:hypothetical protein